LYSVEEQNKVPEIDALSMSNNDPDNASNVGQLTRFDVGTAVSDVDHSNITEHSRPTEILTSNNIQNDLKENVSHINPITKFIFVT
jgi:hypothetical protein